MTGARPSLSLSVYYHISIYLFVCPSIIYSPLSFYLSLYPSIHPSIYPSIHLSLSCPSAVSTYLPVCLSVCPSIYPSIFFSIRQTYSQSYMSAVHFTQWTCTGVMLYVCVKRQPSPVLMRWGPAVGWKGGVKSSWKRWMKCVPTTEPIGFINRAGLLVPSWL